MESESVHLGPLYTLWAWAINNRQKLVIAAAVLAVAGGAVAFYNWRQESTETAAGDALSKLRARPATTPGGSPIPVSPDAFLAVVRDYPKTAAASRALLLAGGALFVEGKYDDARKQFERFLREFPESQFRGDALFGVASCLEAQGKSAEAMSAYKDFIDRRSTDPAASRAKLGLARLSQKDNPEQAFRLYGEVVRAGSQTSVGYQAEIALEELRRTHPNLGAPAPSAPPPPSSALPVPAASAAPVVSAPGTN